MKKREQWGTRFGFIMAAVGSAIGLGNIWRFPYQAYENGGGAFLVPYFFALLTAGIPILIMEFGLGHSIRGAAPSMFYRLGKKFKLGGKLEWLGWWQVLISFVISMYYVVIVAWTISFVIFSLSQAWGTDTQSFFFEEYLKLSGGPFELQGLNTTVLITFLLAWFINWLILFSGVKKGIELANKIFMPLLIVMVFVLMFRTLTLEGAVQGLNYLFTPDFSKILDFRVWTAAYGQIFFSLSICFAIMITYSSYLPKKSDIVNNAFMTGFLNCGFSLLAGIMIFSILGHMAYAEGIGVADVAGQGIGLAFITIPKAINYLPAPQFLGALFFLTLTVAGLSSFISINETIIAAAMDKYNVKRSTAVTVFTLIGVVISLLFCTNAGLYMLDIVDHFINAIGIVISGLIEIIIVGYLIKLSKIQEHINKISDFNAGIWWIVCVKVITPVVLGYMAIRNFINEIMVPYEGYPVNALVLLGWMLVSGILVVAVVMSRHEGHELHLKGHDH
ncbi:MAG: sodium-dependent transporter [Spirochaetota bacterium]